MSNAAAVCLTAASSVSNELFADAVTRPSTKAVIVAIIAIASRTTSFDPESSDVRAAAHRGTGRQRHRPGPMRTRSTKARAGSLGSPCHEYLVTCGFEFGVLERYAARLETDVSEHAEPRRAGKQSFFVPIVFDCHAPVGVAQQDCVVDRVRLVGGIRVIGPIEEPH